MTNEELRQIYYDTVVLGKDFGISEEALKDELIFRTKEPDKPDLDKFFAYTKNRIGTGMPNVPKRPAKSRSKKPNNMTLRKGDRFVCVNQDFAKQNHRNAAVKTR